MPAGHAEHEAELDLSVRALEVTEPDGQGVQAELAAPVENEFTEQTWQAPRNAKYPAVQAPQLAALLWLAASTPAVAYPGAQGVQAALAAPVEYVPLGHTAHKPLLANVPGPQAEQAAELLCAEGAVLAEVP